MASKSNESLLANLLVGLLEIIFHIVMIPVYLIVGAITLAMGSFVVFVIGGLLLVLMILCVLTVVAL